ncbi:MAG: hypothetical protein RML57_10330 [Acidobacteriota bacterium]|nr:hypothetical protein [Acidobacteriota bacterium]
MLLTLVLWALMAVVAYAVGIGLIPPGTFARVGDRIMAALWVGFVVVSNAWLALALVMPLTFWRTLGLTALGVAGLWLYRRRRTPEWTWLPKVDFAAVPPLLWFIGALGLAGLGLLAAQTTKHHDTGMYHSQAVKWLEAYGVTPGIALLQVHLGYASAWYAFVAPFDTGWWRDRLGAAGGFPLALLWVHGCLTIARAQSRTAQVSDWFMLLAGGWMPALFTYCYLSIASLATDIPTAALIVAVAWAMLRNAETIQCGSHNQLPASEVTPPSTVWLPLVLSFGALACKLSALPATVGVALWALWRTHRQSTQWLWLFGTGVLLFTPVTVARFIASGYPFFPSTLGAYPVEWAYDPAALEYITAYIRDFARWTPLPGMPMREGERGYSTGWLDVAWLPRWLRLETLTAIYLGASLVAGVPLLQRTSTRTHTLPWIVAIAWAGSLYVFMTAPTLRLGLGFFVLPPALWVACLISEQRALQALWVLANLLVLTVLGMTAFLQRSILFLTIVVFNVSFGMVVELAQPIQQRLFTTVTKRQIGVAVGALGGLLILVMSLATIVRPNHTSLLIRRFFQPAAFPVPSLKVNHLGDIAVYQPVEGLCWGSPLPCTVEPTPGFTLRNPQRGLAGGFKRLPKAPQR